MKKMWGIWALAILLMAGCSSDESSSSGNAFAKDDESSLYEDAVELEERWAEFLADKKVVQKSDLNDAEKYEQIINLAKAYKNRISLYNFDNPSSEEQDLSVAATDFQNNFHTLLEDGYIAFYSSGYVTPDMEEKISNATELTGMYNMWLDVSIDEYEENHN